MEFIPTHTTIMHTNYLPRLGSLDGGTKRRIAVAPFPSTLPPERVITNYQAVLFKECGPAVLQWVIEGAIRFYESGCKLAKARVVEKATLDYLEGEDWLGSFLKDSCELGEGFEVAGGDLYSAYQVWAGVNGMRVKRSRDFAKTLEANDYQKVKRTQGAFWCGIRLKNGV